jgi:hypothetical protein
MNRILIAALAVVLLAVVVARGQDKTDEDALQEKLDSLCATLAGRIEACLGEKFTGPVPVKLVSPQFIADFAVEMEARMTPGETVEAGKRLAERMRLVPPGFDLQAAQAELLKSQVAGLYDPDKDCFYVVRERAGGVGSPMFAVTAAHELVHAYRDVDKDFWKRVTETIHSDSDQAIAISCLVEGDATLVGYGVGFAHIQDRDPEPFIKNTANMAGNMAKAMRAGISAPGLDQFPYAMREMLLGRYAIGMVLAAEIYKKGGLEALEQAYTEPPRSTEQVLHPEKLLGPEVDEPVVFVGGDPTAALGGGWKLSMANTSGEFDLQIQFREHLGQERGDAAAAGWDGMRYFFCEKQGTAGFIGLVSTWDSEEDAREFARAWIDWASLRDGKEDPARIVTAEDGTLTADTPDGRVEVRIDKTMVLVADGVPADRAAEVFAALASAKPKAEKPR